MQVALLAVLFSLCLVSTVGRGVFMELDVETIPAIPLLEAEPIKRVGDIWKNCTKASDKAAIISVAIVPNPPKPGQKVTITATINLKENVTGGEIDASLKFGFIRIHRTLDLCTTLEKEGQKCPLPAGTATNTITAVIPSRPTGHVTGTIKVLDENKLELACMTIDLTI